MKYTLQLIGLSAMLAIPTRLGAQPSYKLTDLGPAGNPSSQAAAVDNFGMVTGSATASDGSAHAVIWLTGNMTDIGVSGLGGPNSGGGGVNAFGQVMGGAETSLKDPNNENFCGYGSGFQCLAFVWRLGAAMTALPTLGGTNAGWGAINNLGEISGYAETSHKDTACPGTVAANGTGPQLFDFGAVIWGPSPGQIRQLSPLQGDTVAMALGINDNGEAVGTSGSCANTVVPGFGVGPHAVLWQRNGSVTDLGNLGGSVNPSILGVGTVAWAINNRGMVTGTAALPGNKVFHPFLWMRQTGMMDLGVLPGDLVGAGLSMNSAGEIVGASVSGPGAAAGNPRAFVWRQGTMMDLNSLIPADAPLYLLNAFGINDAGEVVGVGVTEDGEVHGFLATPDSGAGGGAFLSKESARPAALSDEARKTVLKLFSKRGR